MKTTRRYGAAALVAEISAALARHGDVNCRPTIAEEDGQFSLTLAFVAPDATAALDILELVEGLQRVADVAQLRGLVATYGLDASLLAKFVDSAEPTAPAYRKSSPVRTHNHPIYNWEVHVVRDDGRLFATTYGSTSVEADLDADLIIDTFVGSAPRASLSVSELETICATLGDEHTLPDDPVLVESALAKLRALLALEVVRAAERA